MLNFTDEEKQLIARHSKVGGWDDVETEGIKSKIRTYLLSNGVQICCYCQLSMHPWHRITIDTEHVLPKGTFPQYTFELQNLNISCKRCNMSIKREDTSFFLGGVGCANPFKSEYYLFIHPNFDTPKDHLRVVAAQADEQVMIKYRIVNDSPKGLETYRYFKLKEIEINTFDKAQGMSTVTSELPAAVAQEVTDVLESQ